MNELSLADLRDDGARMGSRLPLLRRQGRHYDGTGTTMGTSASTLIVDVLRPATSIFQHTATSRYFDCPSIPKRADGGRNVCQLCKG